jgi:hypothetical protein
MPDAFSIHFETFPLYGKSWKVDADKMGGKKGILDSRFILPFAGDAEFNMIPRSSDGQLLFLLNNVSKTAPPFLPATQGRARATPAVT